MSKTGLRISEEEAKKLLGKNYVPPNKNIKTPNLPSPVSGAFNDRYKNDWEREYASYLEQLRHLKIIKTWHYEDWGFRLADGTFIYPDWTVVYEDHIEILDTKGHKRPDWWVKFKILKELFPYFKYGIVKKIKGEWIVKYI